jgi:hypothetical protein
VREVERACAVSLRRALDDLRRSPVKQLIVATLAFELLLLSGARASAQSPAPAPAPPPSAAPAPADQTAPPPPPPPAQPTAPALYAPPPPAPPPQDVHAGSGDIRDTTNDFRPMALSMMGWLPWNHGFGFGGIVRFQIPIVHNGFISSLNNHIAIEPSFGVAYTTWDFGSNDADYLNFLPAVYGLWAFHFSSEFQVYGAVGLGYNFASETGTYAYRVLSGSYFYIDGAVGLFYDLSDAVALRAEVGYGGPKGGVAILF